MRIFGRRRPGVDEKILMIDADKELCAPIQKRVFSEGIEAGCCDTGSRKRGRARRG